MEAPGQLRGVRVSIWPNALGVSQEYYFEIFVYVPTSTLKLKMMMMNLKNNVGDKSQAHKLKIYIMSL